jgi:hypothetical protein
VGSCLAVCELLLPGSAAVYEGRVVAGFFSLLVVGIGFGLLIAARTVAVPYEIGGAALTLPLVFALVLLVPQYLFGLNLGFKRASMVRKLK